jgi:hypothetical protein
MDDYTSNILNDSKNEWSILLINYITPHIVDGFRSIFNEAVRVCEENDEIEKYLMTYQNLLARIPKWNQQMITTEHERIVKLCNCSYLEDILTCVHIIQLKVLSCVRVGNETKKVKIDVPEFSLFLHNVYTNIARKLYSSIYLFEIDVPPLEQQKRNREFELMVQTCIMNTIRDKIPVETILRQFIDETQEVEVTKIEKLVETKPLKEPVLEQPVIEKSSVIVNPSINEKPALIEKPIMNIPQKSFDNDMPTFFGSSQSSKSDLNSSIDDFEKLTQQNTVLNTQKVEFSEKNSVLTFESQKEDDEEPMSLGDVVPLNNLEFEDLDSTMAPESKKSDVVNLEFEEL